jgi:hypothetical protein
MKAISGSNKGKSESTVKGGKMRKNWSLKGLSHQIFNAFL